MRHESRKGENIAAAYHVTWAVACLMQSVFSVAGMWVLFPLSFAFPPYGDLFFAYCLICGATGVLGVGGTVWHIFGAAEHRRSARKRRAG